MFQLIRAMVKGDRLHRLRAVLQLDRPLTVGSTASADTVKLSAGQPVTAVGFAGWIGYVALALCVFAAVALSAAGRIDVIDSQTRYQVGRSLVEHGDAIVRDDDTWFMVFHGRGGQRYTNYRFPHCLIAAAAIMLSDATGPVSEMRRQFFFSLSNAVLCGVIAMVYASWFRHSGRGGKASLAWAAAGIFCTPLWFYGTTAHDDVLGTLIVLLSIYAATRISRNATAGIAYKDVGAIAAGLLLGLGFNCKPPLVLFMPLVVAGLWNRDLTRPRRWLRARVVFFCAALGMIGYELYDLWKFPPSTWAALADERADYLALWPGNPLAGFLSLLVSPGIGAIWYWPAIVLALYGLYLLCRQRPFWQGDTPFAVLAGLSSLAFFGFIASIRFFSGEPAWGPRYLTPMFGVLWLFVPAAASHVRWPKVAFLLTASVAVQIMGLAVEPLRFFTGENVVAAKAFLWEPWTYFHFDRSQLLVRPRQVWDILTYDGPPATEFTPAKAPTLPMVVNVESDKWVEARAYQVFSEFRPWWASYRHLSPEQRPVDLQAALLFLLALGGVGLMLLALTFLPIASMLRRAAGILEPNQHQPSRLRWRIPRRAR